MKTIIKRNPPYNVSMELTKVASRNTLTWEGLSVGKLMAIRDNLKAIQLASALGPVGEDVLIFLKHQDLDTIDIFGDRK